MGKRPWFCAGNLPGPCSTLKDLKAFLAWAEPLEDELENLDIYIKEARDQIDYLEAVARGEIAEPWASRDRGDWLRFIRQVEPMANQNLRAASQLESARQRLNDWDLDP